MIRHYLTFAHQTAAIEETLTGWNLAECWSQEKNILFLRFVQGTQSMFVEISIDLHMGYAIARDQAGRARRNTIDFFEQALGSRLLAASIDEGERIIRLRLAGELELVIFFFGRGSGNVLLLKQGEVAESFLKYHGEYDDTLSGTAESGHRTRDELIAAIRGSDLPAQRALMRSIPELGKRLAAEALHRTLRAEPTSLAGIDEERMTELLGTVDELYSACELSPLFLIYDLPEERVMSLTRLRHLEEQGAGCTEFASVAETIRAYRAGHHRERSVESHRGALARRLATEKGRLERLLEKMRASQEHAARADEYELEGRIILANLSLIGRGADTVTLENFTGESRTIVLDPKLGATANAERRFEKARKTREAAARAVAQRASTEARLASLQKIEDDLARVVSADDLKRVESVLRGEVRMENEPVEKGSPERFRRFVVFGGLEVFAGKSASNNDELTVRFAKPNDYWFHARGSSGSHVVLRWSDSRSKPPKEAIRAAASVAAYYSGGRNAKMVPVAYTIKKHVRKPKGSAVGAVVMDREEVIMVEPKLPDV